MACLWWNGTEFVDPFVDPRGAAPKRCPHDKVWALNTKCDYATQAEHVAGDWVYCDCIVHSGSCTERPFTREQALAAIALAKLQGVT